MQSQVRFNRVLQKVPEKVGGFGAKPSQVQQSSGEGSGEGSGEARSGSTGFPRRFRRGFQRRFRGSGRLWCRARSGSTVRAEKVPEKVWGAFVQSQVRFSRFTAFLEKVPRGFGAEPGQVQQGSGEGSGEGMGGFGAKTGQVQQGSGEGSGEGEALVQSQVKFSRGLEKVPEKVPGGFGAEPGQVQPGSGEGSGEGLGGFGAEPGQVQQGLRPLTYYGNPGEVFGLAASLGRALACTLMICLACALAILLACALMILLSMPFGFKPPVPWGTVTC